MRLSVGTGLSLCGPAPGTAPPPGPGARGASAHSAGGACCSGQSSDPVSGQASARTPAHCPSMVHGDRDGPLSCQDPKRPQAPMLATHSPFRPALTTPGAWAFLPPRREPRLRDGHEAAGGLVASRWRRGIQGWVTPTWL